MVIIGKFKGNTSSRQRILCLGTILLSACFSYPNVVFAEEKPIPAEYKELPTFNVMELGADPYGKKDSGPAFRKAAGSNRIIFVPPGKYRFSSTEKPPCCAYDPEAVLYSKMSNFLITGYGATLIADDSIALSGLLRVDQSKNFAIRGLSFRGSRKGLAPEKENGALGLTSVANFNVSDIQIGHGFEGNGDGIGGDWWVNGTIDNVSMDGVGHCHDVAYLQHVVFRHLRCRGQGPDGGSGMTGISFIEDPPNQKQNHTGVRIDSTNDVSIVDSKITNFDTAALVSTGHHYSFSNNTWYDNRGSSRVLGIGILIKTNPKYQGPPPHDIRIYDEFDRNTVAIKVDGQGGNSKRLIENVDIKAVFSENKKDVSLSGTFMRNVVNSD